jgi:hypothetical protein
MPSSGSATVASPSTNVTDRRRSTATEFWPRAAHSIPSASSAFRR